MQGLPDFDLTLNPHAGVDDWQYEMRREIQEIIPGVFLGPFSACRRIDQLKEKGITHIMCFIDQAEARLFKTDTLMQHFEFQQYIVNDTILQNLIQHFPNVFKQINRALDLGGKVVLCCNGGMSRSPAFVIAYLMERFNLDANQAYHCVQARRLCINPNDGFKCQLKEYELIFRARHGAPSIDGDSRRRRRSRGEENDDIFKHTHGVDPKRYLRDQIHEEQGTNAMSPEYSSMTM